ncbi:MAG TPA: UvrB/UvrC motif-containing protein [Planctomycetota bacterium]|nr:UvrB/UvrC motif-containing protein [Planctomycetota bacterium]
MGMKCDVGSCENEATVHLTEIREGKKHEMHLCERCAAEKGLPGKAHFSISDLLAGIASQAQAQAQKTPRRSKEAACPVCTTTLTQFQSSGRFGCPECYNTFRDDVQGLVEKIHDAAQHVGKVPRRVSSEISLQKDVRQLQLDLKRAIRKEDYEKAAAIRDQIKQIEDKLSAQEQNPPPAAAPKAPPAGGSGGKKKSDGGEKK